MLNDALLPEWLALPPSEAARLALDAARAIDARLAAHDDAAAARLLEDAHDTAWLLRRSRHRAEHLDAIERASL